MEALTDFVKNAGLFTFLHLVITTIFFLVAVVLLFGARSRPAMWAWLGIGIVPAVSGILLWYFRNQALDTGIGLMRRIPKRSRGGRLEARINLAGLTGTIVISLLHFWRRRLNRERKP